MGLRTKHLTGFGSGTETPHGAQTCVDTGEILSSRTIPLPFYTTGEHAMPTKNACLKTRRVNEPYEIWHIPNTPWEWRILKKYKTNESSNKDPYARWFCAVQGSGTQGGYDLGDTYVNDITSRAIKMSAEQMQTHLANHRW